MSMDSQSLRSRARTVALLATLSAAALCGLSPATGLAQGSDRPLILVVPFPPGGSTDIVARIIQPRVAERLGRPVVIENRPGAASQIATQHVARATPDGNTMLVSFDNHALNPVAKAKLPGRRRST